MRNIVFLDEPDKYFDESEFIAHLPRVSGEDELLKKLSETLEFPDYFGNNWNALYDCLCDFHWMAKMGIVLVHHELPLLADDKIKIYLNILFEATGDWRDNEAHYFKVIFPEKSRRFLEANLLM
ncbi:barstar family protein [Mucilaginibacter kameinonensis]|uniref:barstar family protein n=1 Tax=Mucilaginibacter kameinonensis TaxID=452286 RepID=UPI0013CEF570|nr:barstar family protein [Mucilaginibacter kameinonensis]